MTWTNEAKLTVLMRAPWTILSEPSPDDPGEFILRVRELPGLIAIGTPAELDSDFWDALESALRAVLEFGDSIPKPELQKAPYPWEPGAPRRVRRIQIFPTADMAETVAAAPVSVEAA